LVTGGAGFIGSRAVTLLADLGCHVVALDNKYVGLPLPEQTEQVTPVNADIRDREGMKAVLAEHRVEAVLHLAAVHHIPTCEREPHLAMDVNIMGTQSLLEAMEAAGCRNLVMASSGAVYRWEEGFLDEATTGTGATDVYSITKLANEYQIGGWADRTGSRAHAMRLFNTIGSGDPNGHLIPDILQQIAAGDDRPVIRLGNTAPKRDYIYVDDVAAGFVAALGHVLEGEARDIFNLSTGSELSVGGLVELMGEIMGKVVQIEKDPSRFRKIDRLQQLGDPSKFSARTGWQPAWTTRDALVAIMRDLGYATSGGSAAQVA
jgi:UDP-glucose 4-epimerase